MKKGSSLLLVLWICLGLVMPTYAAEDTYDDEIVFTFPLGTDNGTISLWKTDLEPGIDLEKQSTIAECGKDAVPMYKIPMDERCSIGGLSPGIYYVWQSSSSTGFYDFDPFLLEVNGDSVTDAKPKMRLLSGGIPVYEPDEPGNNGQSNGDNNGSKDNNESGQPGNSSEPGNTATTDDNSQPSTPNNSTPTTTAHTLPKTGEPLTRQKASSEAKAVSTGQNTHTSFWWICSLIAAGLGLLLILLVIRQGRDRTHHSVH